MTKDEILRILAHPVEAKAWAEGKEIEHFNLGWRSDPDPDFMYSNYRIKPKVHTEIRCVNIYKHGPGAVLYDSEEEAKEHTFGGYGFLVRVFVPITWTDGEGLED